MLKGIGSINGGRKLVMLGLSHRNLDKLREGMPIPVLGAEMEIEEDILIFAAATEDDLLAELRKFVGPNTKINIEVTSTSQESDREKDS